MFSRRRKRIGSAYRRKFIDVLYPARRYSQVTGVYKTNWGRRGKAR